MKSRLKPFGTSEDTHNGRETQQVVSETLIVAGVGIPVPLCEECAKGLRNSTPQACMLALD